MNKQRQFVEQCKERKKTKNFAQELSQLLGVNVDAAYRRSRGVTQLTFDEINKMCKHYSVSFDSIINYEGRTVPFQYNPMFNEEFSMRQYLTDIRNQMEQLTKAKDSKITITAVDIPYFRLFGFPSLRRFKLFFWQRSVLNLDEFQPQKFDVEKEEPEIDTISEDIFKFYHGIESTEIWAPETLDSTFKQIEYYIESGLFKDENTVVSILDDMVLFLNHLEAEAMLAKKTYHRNGEHFTSNFSMYQSDIFMSNNSILAFVGGTVFSYVSFNSFNSLMSFSPSFSEECQRWVEQIRVKSILLSDVSERLRYQFFQGLRNKIKTLKADFIE
jgi:hypothetical protein